MGELKYIGDELSIFKDATNWKNYWYNSIRSFVRGDVLEVGAGIGVNTSLFVNNPAVRKVVAVEPDKSLADQIVPSVADHRKIEVHQGFLSDLPASQKFDTIIYIDVIEHIEDDKSELQLAKSHLREGGHLVVLVPAYNFLFSPFDKAIGHFRRYNRKMLSDSVPNDLKKMRLFYLDAPGVLASLVNKYILKQSYPSKNQIRNWDGMIIPVSKIVDRILFRSIGKSLIGVWSK